MTKPFVLQSLSPKQARLCLKVQEFWEKILEQDARGKTVLLAISGGADSTAMAYILKALSQRMHTNLVAVTINHGLRQQARDDVAFVQNLCNELNIPLQCHSCDTKTLAKTKQIGIEEAARLLRYRILSSACAELGADYIALAHNVNDLCEDVLMRLTRGTGWPALGGMTGYDKERNIIRPLLHTERTDIENFLKELGLLWCTDETNAERTYTRNRFRHNILPQLQKENPQLSKAIKHLWYFAREDETYWKNYIKQALADNPWAIECTKNTKSVFLNKKLLMSLPMVAHHRLIIAACNVLEKNSSIRGDTVFRIQDAWRNKHGRKLFEISDSLRVLVQANQIICQKDLRR